jgi:energy-coupling factor transport system ATP-binding protein
MPDNFAVVENLSYTHWNQETPTLRGVSFSIARGSLCILVGPGGSGKSTLASVFNGEIPQLLGGSMEGRVLVDGQDSSVLPVKDLSRIVGHLFQDPESMFATLSVEDEIAFGPENLCMDTVLIRAEVDKLLGRMGLEPFRERLVWNLSGGQIQKLGIAAVLSLSPRMVVLDEPTANLDPRSTRSVHEFVLDLRARGVTVLLVTKELDDFLLANADQLVALNEGEIIADGPVQEVLRIRGSALRDLGIWLPETVEVGLALAEAQVGDACAAAPIPVTAAETLAELRGRGLLPPVLEGGAPMAGARSVEEPLLVEAKALGFEYPNGYCALRDVDFFLRKGEMLAIVGRNGAGKSTLAKLLVGLLKPGSGDLSLFGKGARKWRVESLAAKIGLVFQNPEHQFLTDTVHDEIAYSLLARGVKDEGEIERLVSACLERFDLAAHRDEHPFSLSAGMKRRLGVATMLVCEPEALIVDEPTYGQDKGMTHTLLATMEEIRARGVGIVMITHDMRLVQEYATRVMVMSEGRAIYDGDPSRLFASTELLEEANLMPTLLQEMLALYEEGGGRVVGSVCGTEGFLAALERSSRSAAGRAV